MSHPCPGVAAQSGRWQRATCERRLCRRKWAWWPNCRWGFRWCHGSSSIQTNQSGRGKRRQRLGGVVGDAGETWWSQGKHKMNFRKYSANRNQLPLRLAISMTGGAGHRQSEYGKLAAYECKHEPWLHWLGWCPHKEKWAFTGSINNLSTSQDSIGWEKNKIGIRHNLEHSAETYLKHVDDVGMFWCTVNNFSQLAHRDFQTNRPPWQTKHTSKIVIIQ